MNRDKKIIKISIIGIIVNIILVIFKATVGVLVNSIAIILDAINNLSDTMSAIITIIGTKLSSKKPDKQHPYGHGRIEYFSLMIIAIIILIAGLASLRESIIKVIYVEKAEYTIPSIIVIIVAIFTKIFLGKYVKKEGEELKSGNLIATGIDCMNDAIISTSTLIAAIISIVWGFSIEGYIGVIISVVIIKTAVSILQDTINQIIGVRADTELINNLKEEILKFDEVLGVYDIILHNYGPQNFIGTAHIQVKDDMNAKEIHRLTRRISVVVYQKLGIIMTIGIYASNDGEEYQEIKDFINELIKKYETILQIHGFYVDEDYRAISFDLIFSFEEKEPEKIVQEICKTLKNKYSRYNFNIIIDKDYSD